MAKLVSKGGKGSGNWGHAGRPGKVGGSAPQGGGSSAGLNDAAATEILRKEILGDVDSFRKRRGYFADRLVKVFGEKVRRLTDETKLDPSIVRAVVSEWAYNANGTPIANTIQQTVANMFHDQFGTQLSDYQEEQIKLHGVADKLGEMGETEVAYGSPKRQVAKFEDVEPIVKQIYADTQAFLKEHGITHVTVYRGFKLYDGEPNSGGRVAWNPNAAESWTLDPDVAEEFASSSMRGATSLVIEESVPAERILSIPTTGFGAVGEEEVVVIGGELVEATIKQSKMNGE